MRLWYWVLPALAVVLVVYVVYAVASFISFDLPVFSFAFIANGIVVFPVLILSLAINQFLLIRRAIRVVQRTERVLIASLVAVVALLVVSSFWDGSGIVALIGWLVLLPLAIATTAVIAVTTARQSARTAPDSEGDIQDLGDIDDLFGDDSA